MKRSRFIDNPILSILKQAESGIPVPELCREHGMSRALPFTIGVQNTVEWTLL